MEVIHYRDTPQGSLHLHLVRPAPDQPVPTAVVLFHGGGWNTGKPEQMEPYCRALAAAGLLAISAEYRVRTRHGTLPTASVSDAMYALAWARDHAAELGVDPARIVAGGASAGAYLALSAATLTRPPERGGGSIVPAPLAAIVLLSTVVDVGPDGFGGEAAREALAPYAPMKHLRAGLPPAFLLHATDDDVVSVDRAFALARRWRRAGNECFARRYHGGGHSFHRPNPADDSNFQKVMKTLLRFIEDQGLLNPPGGQAKDRRARRTKDEIPADIAPDRLSP